MRNRSIFRRLPAWLGLPLLKRIVARNYDSARRADALLYFPRGMNKVGDRLIAEMEKAGVSYIPRYDASFEQLQNLDRTFKPAGDKLVILSPVRFLYRTFNEGNDEYSKGNDHIIRGLALYKAVNKYIEVHFFEKGDDLHHAKRLCDELGLSDVVVWHKPVPFKDLMHFYASADICFDQVGDHIIGSGMYALFLGKPLIANASNLGFLGETPILSATTAEEVFERLVIIERPCNPERLFRIGPRHSPKPSSVPVP